MIVKTTLCNNFKTLIWHFGLAGLSGITSELAMRGSTITPLNRTSFKFLFYSVVVALSVCVRLLLHAEVDSCKQDAGFCFWSFV